MQTDASRGTVSLKENSKLSGTGKRGELVRSMKSRNRICTESSSDIDCMYPALGSRDVVFEYE